MNCFLDIKNQIMNILSRSITIIYNKVRMFWRNLCSTNFITSKTCIINIFPCSRTFWISKTLPALGLFQGCVRYSFFFFFYLLRIELLALAAKVTMSSVSGAILISFNKSPFAKIFRGQLPSLLLIL